jgi:hypothetical protein
MQPWITSVLSDVSPFTSERQKGGSTHSFFENIRVWSAKLPYARNAP